MKTIEQERTITMPNIILKCDGSKWWINRGTLMRSSTFSEFTKTKQMSVAIRELDDYHMNILNLLLERTDY